jgi:hypothetical protein
MACANTLQIILPQYLASHLTRFYSPSPIVNVVCPGRVATNLPRHFAAKSIIHKAIVYAFIALTTMAPDVGSRQLVMAAKTTPTENGKFIRPYMTDAEYEG